MKNIFPGGDYQIEKIVLTYSTGKAVCLTEGFIGAPYAGDVRDGKVDRIDVYLV